MNKAQLTFTLRTGQQVHLTKHPRCGSLPADVAAATPWGLRMTNPATGKRGWQSLKTADAKTAKQHARDLLEAAAAGAEAWTTHAQINHRRAGLLVGTIAQEYAAAGCPRLKGMDILPRTGRALDDERRNLASALDWWADKPLSSVNLPLMRAFAAARAPRYRTAELELVSLSNAARFALEHGRIPVNPFRGRRNFRNPDTIVHCHTEAPASTEELHALCGWLLRQPHLASYGAALLWSAFTGLRPGEIGYLRRAAQPGQPGSLSTLTADGQTFQVMHVHREKRGINPAVRLHAAALDFLAAWHAHLDLVGTTHLDSAFHFPHPLDRTRPVIPAGNAQGCAIDKHLKRAAAAIGITANRRPHAMRAYYVRCRRSQGALDSTIASELGERTGEALIVSTYGDPAGLRGDGKFDWLPATGSPCWSVLSPSVPENIIPISQAAPFQDSTTTDTMTDTTCTWTVKGFRDLGGGASMSMTGISFGRTEQAARRFFFSHRPNTPAIIRSTDRDREPWLDSELTFEALDREAGYVEG